MGARLILVVASPNDSHARIVARKLGEAGHEVRFLDWSNAVETLRVTYPIGCKAPGPSAWLGEDIDPGRIDTVWYRRAPSPLLPDVREDDERRFAIAEWVSAVEGFLSSLPARFVSSPARQRQATKPRQLEAALRAGLRVPETLITNEPQAALEFVERHGGKVVHKVLTATNHFFPDTRRFDQHARDALHNLPLAPTMFQEEIIGPAELRITVVGKQLFTARILRRPGDDGVDSRLNLDRPYEPAQLPPDVERRLLTMMDDLGLLFGTIDMKFTNDDEYVFFEVNTQGQFLYVEIMTGLPISDGVADLLMEARPISRASRVCPRRGSSSSADTASSRA